MKVFSDGKFINITDEEIEYGAYAAITIMGENIKNVRKLHQAYNHEGFNISQRCIECDQEYPCQTVKILDGEKIDGH